MPHKIYWGPLKKPLEWSLKTILTPWSYSASVVYHDILWYPSHQKRVHDILSSCWGRLFKNWEIVQLPPEELNVAGWKDVGKKPAVLKKKTLRLIMRSIKTLVTCIHEAPEFILRKRRL